MELDKKMGLYTTGILEVPELEGPGTNDAAELATNIAATYHVIVEELDGRSKNGHVQLCLYGRDVSALERAQDHIVSR